MRNNEHCSVVVRCIAAFWIGTASAALEPGGWEPSVRERLDALIERNRGNKDAYAVFDFDYTTAIGDLSYVCMWQLMETFDFKFDDFRSLMSSGLDARYVKDIEVISDLYAKLRPFAGKNVVDRPEWREFVRRFWALYRRIWSDLGDYSGYLWRSRVFTGYTTDELIGLAKAALPRAIAMGGLKRDANATTEKRGLVIAPEIKDLFRKLREAGIAVYIVSGSYRDTLVVATGPDFGLGLPQDNVFGAELRKGKNGALIAEMVDGCVKSGHKPEFIRANIAPRHHGAEPVLAAGDSMGDYTMLTEFRGLQLALLFARNWKNPKMRELAASGGRVAVQGRNEVRGCFIPSRECIEP